MRRQRMIALSLFLVPLVAVILAIPAAAGVSAGSWQVVTGPSGTELMGVQGTGPNDVWAVGTSTIEHWNGSSWSISFFRYDVFFQQVTAISSTDAWAVGGNGKPKAFHWNGTGWTEASPAASSGTLGGVDALSSTNVWAVGSVGIGPPMVQRWNGSSWQAVSSPNPPGGRGSLNAVSALSSTDIWAVGNTIDGSLVHPLIEHWNGSAWSIVPAPRTNDELSLADVTAFGANDVWAVGFGRQGQTYRPRILHWNGAAWSFSKLPSLPPNGTLDGVGGRSTTDLWAVGAVPNSLGYSSTMILHWDGAAWRRVSSPNPGGETTSNMLHSVVAFPSGNAWTVGHAGLTERFVP
jgi:hypothetical protein